jgi:bifunctional DNA-binding transcriptional regulator/antitoxin component of YhaV-PrlF toxin-antitoxin module
MAHPGKIQKISSKGQVTLPAAWRKAIKTEHITVSVTGDTLQIKPARLDESGEYTVFDAIRDNRGQGLTARDLAKLVRSVD